MNYKIIFIAAVLLGTALSARAGNPERTGQAGATQLLVNPYARSSGVNGLNVSTTEGIESAINNIAGLAHTQRTEVVFAHTVWMDAADISINTLGFSQRLGENGGVLGLAVMAFDIGDIPITTIDQPDGNLGTFSPTIMNIGLSYAKAMVSERIFVGATVRLVHESIPDVASNGVSFDGGVQYRSKGKDGRPGNFSLGVSLRNVGPQMTFRGDGLSFRANTGGQESNFDSKVSTTASPFELPALLYIGGAYRFGFGGSDSALVRDHNITPMVTFVSHSFARDQFGFGLEYSFKNMFMARASYLYEEDLTSEEETRNAFTGLALGATIELPVSKTSNTTFGVDYSLRQTYFFGFTHTIGLRLDL